MRSCWFSQEVLAAVPFQIALVPTYAGRCFATKINYMKAHTRSQTDVRCRMILKQPFDHFGIGRRVVQFLARFFVEIRGYIEPGTKANCGT
jgi:hypothetical protein